MITPGSGEVTRILALAENLDRGEALDRLIPVVYDELRVIAAARLRAERSGHSLQTGGLVHEAYLRLASDGPAWVNRAHFFQAAAEAMRRVLIDHARRRARSKRGGDPVRVELSEAELGLWPDPHALLAVDEAIRRLEEVDARAADEPARVPCWRSIRVSGPVDRCTSRWRGLAMSTWPPTAGRWSPFSTAQTSRREGCSSRKSVRWTVGSSRLPVAPRCSPARRVSPSTRPRASTYCS